MSNASLHTCTKHEWHIFQDRPHQIRDLCTMIKNNLKSHKKALQLSLSPYPVKYPIFKAYVETVPQCLHLMSSLDASLQPMFPISAAPLLPMPSPYTIFSAHFQSVHHLSCPFPVNTLSRPCPVSTLSLLPLTWQNPSSPA